jgi:hypothetical protein
MKVVLVVASGWLADARCAQRGRERQPWNVYTPGNGAVYPNTSFGRSLQTVAQVIRMQLGLQVATLDLGGWDTHEYQGDSGAGYFFDKLAELGSGVSALLLDLSNDNGTDHTKRITVVVMSEFGRSFQENASRGTDHGHGNVMLVAGGSVNGGQIHGTWPGLATEQLYDRRDLAITTDYRRVLSEILIRRLGNPKLGAVFPGFQNYSPLGVVQGADIAPDYTVVTPPPTRIYLPRFSGSASLRNCPGETQRYRETQRNGGGPCCSAISASLRLSVGAGSIQTASHSFSDRAVSSNRDLLRRSAHDQRTSSVDIAVGWRRLLVTSTAPTSHADAERDAPFPVDPTRCRRRRRRRRSAGCRLGQDRLHRICAAVISQCASNRSSAMSSWSLAALNDAQLPLLML